MPERCTSPVDQIVAVIEPVTTGNGGTASGCVHRHEESFTAQFWGGLSLLCVIGGGTDSYGHQPVFSV